MRVGIISRPRADRALVVALSAVVCGGHGSGANNRWRGAHGVSGIFDHAAVDAHSGLSPHDQTDDGSIAAAHTADAIIEWHRFDDASLERRSKIAGLVKQN